MGSRKAKQGEEPKPPLQFTVKLATATVKIEIKPIVVKGIRIKQLGVLLNRAKTCQRSQEISKFCLFCIKYDYSTANCMYVVLSRVRTRNILFL